MTSKPKMKPVGVVLHDERILLECPFCGMTLIKTNYLKIKKLLEDQGPPRGKTCSQCGGVSILKLSDDVREAIEAKMPQA
ncbi:MAG: hypothetical protein V2B18_19300 [Pseudomonadota bacterium]|jgi:hypothetical protein